MKRSLLSFALSLPFAAGCVELGEDGLSFAPRLPYESSIRDVGEPVEWRGERLEVDVERGFVEVIGDPDATQLVVTARAMTWASHGDVASARAIHDAILGTASVALEEDRVVVRCSVVEDDVGSAQAYATQCNVRIVVPAPNSATHHVYVRTGLGDVFLQRLTTGADGHIELDVAGKAESWELRGNVVSRAGAHDLEITPLPDGLVDVESTIALAGRAGTEGASDAKDTTGSTLRLPTDFATRSLELWSQSGSILTSDYPDLSPASQSRPGPAPATLVRARAEWGHVELHALKPVLSRTRTTALGPITTKP